MLKYQYYYLAKLYDLCYNKTVGGDDLGSNNSKDLFKHLEETLNKVDLLMEENKLFKIEISTLKANHQKEISILHSRVESLESENKKLRDIINKDSSNSSKPPSSDGFKKIHNSREKTNKRVGGQKGHKGDTLKLFDKPTKVIEHKKELCECGCHLVYSNEYKAKQQVDIEVITNITEHRAFTGVCPDCNSIVVNQLPKELINTVTYGNNIKSFAAMLSSEGAVSINRTNQIIKELTNGIINLSDATIVNFNKELSKKLEETIIRIKEKLLISPVNHKDETSVRINNSLHWFHVLSNKECTLYFTHAKRGNIADNDIDILPSYSGILVHDHLKGLYNFNCEHAECNAHILRYLKSAVENEKRAWAADMIKFFVDTNNIIKDLKANSVSCFSQIDIQTYLDRYDEILLNGHQEFHLDPCKTKNYNGDDMKLLRRLKEYKTEHLRFITDFRVPFDNNLAERDLRMIKAKSKISGCFRSEKGGEVFANIKSYTSTLRKNSKNIFQGISLAFSGDPVTI